MSKLAAEEAGKMLQQAIDRRGSLRVATQKTGAIVLPTRTLACHLVNASDTGVRLAGFSIPSCPDKFSLRVGDSDPRSCRIVWRSADALGAQYLEDERIRRLRQSIARFERLLVDADAAMAPIYRAEIAAAQVMIAELQSERLPHRRQR